MFSILLASVNKRNTFHVFSPHIFDLNVIFNQSQPLHFHLMYLNFSIENLLVFQSEKKQKIVPSHTIKWMTIEMCAVCISKNKNNLKERK